MSDLPRPVKDRQDEKSSAQPVVFDAPALWAEDSKTKSGVARFDTTSSHGRNYLDNKDSVVKINSLSKPNDVGAAYDTGGTGFFVKKDGTLVTDYHVIKNAESITVTTSDGKTYKAQVVDVETSTDLALLKVTTDKPADFKPVKLAESSSHVIKNGGNLTALGFPLKVEQLHISPGTFDRVSPLGRFNPEGGLLPKENPLRPIIASAMVIDTGNSGGPLFDKEGQVVGVVDLKTRSEIRSLSTPVEELHRLMNRNSTNFLTRMNSGTANLRTLLGPEAALPIQTAPVKTQPETPNFFQSVSGRLKSSYNFEKPEPPRAKPAGSLIDLANSKTLPLQRPER